MGTHILLDGQIFENKYLNLAMEFPEERWQEILTLTAGDMDADISEYQGDRFAVLKDGTRTVLKGEAVLQIYRACVEDCKVMEYRSWTCDKFWSDMENGGYGTRENFWGRLRDKGQSDAYLLLLRTAGLGYAERPAAKPPWWLFSEGAVKGRFYGEWAGLTAPQEARQIVAQLDSTGALEEVIAMAHSECAALARTIERDHREVVKMLARAGEESHWLLGFEFGT